jgi:hypothetical protein
MPTSDIPCVLTRVTEDVYMAILCELMELNQWELMCKAVEMYQETVDENTLSNFARDMSVINMIQTVQADEGKKIQILRCLLDGGAYLKNGLFTYTFL